MNTEKILELLGTTPEQKMATLHRMEADISSAEESANDLLNAELFGTGAPRRAAKEDVLRRPAPAPLKEKLKKVNSALSCVGAKEGEDCDEDGCLAEDDDVKEAAMAILNKLTAALDEKVAADPEAQDITISIDDVRALLDNIATTYGLASEDSEDEMADEAVATEMTVETKSRNFPDEFNFDEQAFGEEYGIPAESITCIHVPEDPEAKIVEHIEVSFKFEDSTVTLDIMSDNTVEETVDAQVIEPAQFAARFEEQEEEDGTKTNILVLDLVDEEAADNQADGAVKSEEDTLTKSEGDEEHKDEDGKGSTDEFVEEAGLDLDGFYSDTHGMKKADRSVHEVKAQESLAADAWGEDDYAMVYGEDALDTFYFRREMEVGGAGREMLDTLPNLSTDYPNWDAIQCKPEGITVYAKGRNIGQLPAPAQECVGAKESLAARIIRTSK